MGRRRKATTAKGARGHPRHFLFEWREARGYTQEQLGERVGVSGSNISLLENGKQNYTQRILEDLAIALGTDPASLLSRDPTDPEGIWSVWQEISPAERPRAIEVLKAFTRTAAQSQQGERS